MKEVTVEEVFTPGSPAKLTYIDRVDPERQINRALRNPGIQIVIYGHSGSGKTTALFNLLNDKSINHIKTRCTKGDKIEDVLLDAFSQLGTFYISSTSAKEESEVGANFKFGLEFFGGGVSGKSKGTEEYRRERLVEIKKNPNLLAKLFGAVDSVWVIEDFHKLEAGPKQQLSQVMKVFMDAAAEFPKAKIIALGAVDSARQVVHYDSEMDNRVSEVMVPLMKPKELHRIIDMGEIHLNISIPPEMKEKIVAYSSGLASVTHQLCSLACEGKKVERSSVNKIELTEDELDYAINEYVSEKSDSLKSIYEQATKESTKRKFEAPEKLLELILKADKDSFSVIDISKQFAIAFKDYKSNNLRKYLMELTEPNRGEMLRYNKNADNFSFSSPFLRGYCYIQLMKKSKGKKSIIDLEHENADLLKNYLYDEFQKFIKSRNDDDDDLFDLSFSEN